jgi:aminopeptidase N
MRRSLPFVAVLVAACASAPSPAPSVPVTPSPPVDTAPPVPPVPVPPSFRPLPLITWGALPPGAQRAVVPELTQDLRHQVVRLRFDWTRRAVIGSTTLRIAATAAGGGLSQITLDAAGLRIQRVTHGDRPLGFTHEGPVLRIQLAAPLAADAVIEVTVEYEAVRPPRGVHFIDRRHVVWAQGFAEDTRYWIPTVDRLYDKTTWEFFVRVPQKERALSNGRLVGTRRLPDGEVEWHWRLDQPASTYLMSVVTGDYVVLRDRWRDISLGYWTYRDSIEATWRGFGRTPRAMEFFSQWTGVHYPWSKYDQVVTPDFVFGGMENVTAVTMSDDAILHPAWAEPRSNADQLVAHELAHMWFGDYVTMRHWDEAWLSEGFATFMAALFIERAHGAAAGALSRRDAHEQTIAADRRNRRPLVYGRWVTDPAEVYFSGHIYPRGSSVLQMLRRIVGDSTLRAGLNRYLRSHPYQSVTSADLRRALEETSGRDLSRFFAQWVYGAGVPAFRVGWAFDSVRSEVALTAVQVQPRDSLTGLFHADVDVEVLTDSGIVRQVAAVRGETTAVIIPVPAPPRSIRWDAGDWLLDLADFPRPTAMLAWQLAHDSDVLGRIEAIEALAPRVEREAEARDAVARAARDDSLWMVRARALAALAPIVNHDSARMVVINATRDSDTRVREAAALALARATGNAEATNRLRALAQNDRSWWVRTAAMGAMVSVDSVTAVGIAREMLRREEWRDLARVAALEGLARMRSPESRALIVEQLGAGARQGRVAAINALVAQGTQGDTASSRVLEPLLNDEDPFIRAAAAGALGRIGDAESRAALQTRRGVEQEARVRGALDQAIRRLGS